MEVTKKMTAYKFFNTKKYFKKDDKLGFKVPKKDILAQTGSYIIYGIKNFANMYVVMTLDTFARSASVAINKDDDVFVTIESPDEDKSVEAGSESAEAESEPAKDSKDKSEDDSLTLEEVLKNGASGSKKANS